MAGSGVAAGGFGSGRVSLRAWGLTRERGEGPRAAGPVRIFISLLLSLLCPRGRLACRDGQRLGPSGTSRARACGSGAEGWNPRGVFVAKVMSGERRRRRRRNEGSLVSVRSASSASPSRSHLDGNRLKFAVAESDPPANQASRRVVASWVSRTRPSFPLATKRLVHPSKMVARPRSRKLDLRTFDVEGSS